MKTQELPQLPVGLLDEEGCMTKHAEKRLSERGIPRKAVIAALLFGRTVHVRGADIFVIGRKEVNRSKQDGLDLSGYEGTHVVCSGDGSVITVYRNHELRGLRPRRRSRRSQQGGFTVSAFRQGDSWSSPEFVGEGASQSSINVLEP